jgi:hypothetical protein
MIGLPITNSFSDQKVFTKNEIISLSKIRIIKKNLVHVHGFPSSLANTEKLGQFEYFGQYGKIQKILLSSKTNTETNKKTFSVYITYSNEKEASFAILAVDSLLVEGKLIRAFFGTTKYCNYFLNNSFCPNEDKCMFLHKLVQDKDIVIDINTVFSYNEHLNLAKKIIQFSNPDTRKIIMNLPKHKNTIFPNIDFIFLNEDQKEHYLHSSEISYIKSNANSQDNNNYNLNNNNYGNFIRNDIKNNSNFNFGINRIHKNLIKNNSIGDLGINNIPNNTRINSLKSLSSKENCCKNINLDPYEMYKIFKKPVKQILLLEVVFTKKNNNKLWKKMEFNYFKKELKKNGINIYSLFDGCLDYTKDFDNDD